jgi:predicted transcriptional regulator
MKRCSRCKQELALSKFDKSRRAKDKLNHRCTKCNRAAAKERYEKKHGTAEERKTYQDNLLEYIEYLRKHNYTLKEIATRVGLDESTISYYLSGKRKVGTQAVKKWIRS